MQQSERSDPGPAPHEEHLASLNPAQRQAVVHGISPGRADPARPLLVIAGAGSGKTNTLAHRVAHLVLNGADPNRILLMTFSRRAAAEMTQRAARILARVLGARGAGEEALSASLGWAGTFHGIAARLLREIAGTIGLDPAFTIHDREDSADLMNLVRHDCGFSHTETRFPSKRTCLAIYSRLINAQADLGETLQQHFPWCSAWETALETLFAAYVAAKQAQAVLDYDDLLLYLAHALAEPAIAAAIAERFDHVLVDEYQDTNSLQARILLALKPDGAGLTVVGDDAQAIYSFRAATVRNILDFPACFSPPAEIVLLERNYRSTRPVLAAANGVIALAAERFAKTLVSERPGGELPALVLVRDEADQARFVATRVLENREQGARLKQQAVLFRTASHSGALEVELTRRNIPFVKFGGLKFLESGHVKDVLAVLRFGQNPRDRVSGFRVLMLLPGVGPATARKLLDALEQAAAPLAALRALSAPARAGQDWPAFIALMETLAARPGRWPADMAAVRTWYEPHLERLHEDADTRRADLIQLESIAAGYGSRERFLTELTLDPPDATSDKSGVPYRDEDYLVLSTIHSAKGQEWKSVFVLNCVDGCIPADLATGTAAEIEEERRLLYVAMTRARDNLSLMVPQRFFTHNQPAGGDRHVYAARTRFIPDSLLGLFSRQSWPPAAPPPPGPRAPDGPRIDLAGRMRAMFRPRT